MRTAISPRFATRTFEGSGMAPRILTEAVTLPDQLTVARAASVPLVVLLYAWNFPHNEYWATAIFCVAMAADWLDGRIARSRGVTSPLGSLLDPIADKVLVLAVLVMLIEDGVWPGWMVAAIVAREILISGLRLAAIERGVVIAARDLGKLKTWAQAVAAALGGFAAAGAWHACLGRVRHAAWRCWHHSPKAAQAPRYPASCVSPRATSTLIEITQIGQNGSSAERAGWSPQRQHIVVR